jgi:nucleoside-diphosphate-sugar epimerase
VTRLRPGFVMQRGAGSAFARYGVPAWLPTRLLRLVLLLPLDRRLQFPVVHSDDVADAVVRVLERQPGGAFNLAAEPPITRDTIAEVLGARAVHVPASVLHAVLMASWRLHLQPLEPGWLDLGMSVPLMDTARAHREIGWEPEHDAVATLAQALAGIADSAGTASPVLRPRSVPAELRTLLQQGPASMRRMP